jgi:hypothetical protein
MLTYDELLEQIKHLTIEERLDLLEAIAKMVKEDFRLQNSPGGSNTGGAKSSGKNLDVEKYTLFIHEEWLHLSEEVLKAQGIDLRGTPVEDILGIARSGNGTENLVYEDESSILKVLASQPDPQDILALKPSNAFRAKFSELLQRSTTNQLSTEETSELNRFLGLEHLVRLAKANAAKRIANSSSR